MAGEGNGLFMPNDAWENRWGIALMIGKMTMIHQEVTGMSAEHEKITLNP